MEAIQELNKEQLAKYQISNPVWQKGIDPAGAACPKNTTELKEIVEKANAEKRHLVPVSSTGPHQKKRYCLFRRSFHAGFFTMETDPLDKPKKPGSDDRTRSNV